MNSFPVPPDVCLVLKAFAETSSLREASAVLGIDAGALARKISKISADYGLIYKDENRWQLTEEGRSLAEWVTNRISVQNEILKMPSKFKLASPSWITEDIVIPSFKYFDKSHQYSKLWDFHSGIKDEEKKLFEGLFDFIFTDSIPFDPSIAHKKIYTDDLIIVAPGEWKNKLSQVPKSEVYSELSRLPYLSLVGIPSDNVLTFSPEVVAALQVIDLNALRSAIISNLGWGVLPSLAVSTLLKSEKLYKVPIKVEKKVEYAVWWHRSRKDLGPSVNLLNMALSEQMRKLALLQNID